MSKIMQDIVGNWESERVIKPEHVDYLIEQAEKFTRVKEIYQKGGEAWEDHAGDVIFDRRD